MLDVRFQPVTNREDWQETFQVSEEEDGSLIDITGAQIVLVVRDHKTQDQMLMAEVSDGITLTDASNGEFEVLFSADDMASLSASTYDVGLVLTLAGGTTQILRGTLPVLDGVVNAP